MIALCYGTRPQIIKASVLRRALLVQGPVCSVDTGQHYDFALNGLLYRQLEVEPPDHFLEVGSGSHAAQTGAILTRMEPLLQELRPRAVVVIGDTNSTLGCTLAAAKLGLPVAHVEAGLRARDLNMAEEINRRVVDAVASVLCTPSASATERLRRERPDGCVVQTGDVAHDVLQNCLDRLPSIETLLPWSGPTRFGFATLHRAELTSQPDLLIPLLRTLGDLPVPVLLAMHPRTRAVLTELGETRDRIGNLWIREPVGYLETLALVRVAQLVITDSGGVQREAYWLGTPCFTIRRETEWTETVEVGANQLVDPATAAERLPALVERYGSPDHQAQWDRTCYGNGDAARRVADALMSWLPATG